MAITVTQLKAFIAVVQGGSVTAAADELIVTQPSVSSAIAALSSELGCELFERAGRGIRLTDAGIAFAPYATDVLGLLEHGRQAALESGVLASRRLQIAAVTTAAESFVPPLMRSFADEHPDVELTLQVGNREFVLDRLLTHSADVAISGTPPPNERLRAYPVLENEIVCITAAEDPVAADGPRDVSELSQRPWLLREPGSGTRTLNEQYLAEHRIDPVRLVMGSNGAIKQAARAGLGISLLSRAAVEAELAAGLVAEIALADRPPSRPWYVLWSAVGPTRAAVQSFVEFAKAQAVSRPSQPAEPPRVRPARRARSQRAR